MDTASLDYHLPPELIAQQPAAQRDYSRLLVLDRQTGGVTLGEFRDLPGYLRSGDVMVLNDTQVIRARLRGRKPTGGHVELFLLRERAPGEWEALARPSARIPPGTEIALAADLRCVVEEALPEGRRRVTFRRKDVLTVLEQAGEIPLPPYIQRDAPDPGDLRRYQTVYAAHPGAVAAPTAGLHFTEVVFAGLQARGVETARLTLHVGYGTFQPIRAERLEDHHVEAEEFVFPEETAERLNAARRGGGRIVAVGTTSVRVLETCCKEGVFAPGAGQTECYIHPPYAFQGVDALVTNFHLPKSSLLALVCAFGGVAPVLEAYRRAVEARFRFYSYGDAMLIL